MKKICSKCKIEKHFEEFSKDKKSKDALKDMCIYCVEKSWDKYNLVEINKYIKIYNCEVIKSINDNSDKLNRAYKLKNIRNLSKKANYGKFDEQKTISIIGCTYKQLLDRFKSQLYPHPISGIMMTMKDIGKGAQVDHIKPLSSFLFENESEIKKAIHWNNLQVLWKDDNLKKHTKPYLLWLNENLN